MANVKITELGSASTPLAGSELIEIVQGGVNKKVEVNEVGGGGGGGSSTPTTFGTITKSGLAFTFSTGFSWLFSGVSNANTTSITRTLTAATDNYKRIDVAYGDGSNNILIQQGVEALDVALKPNIPTNCVEICSFNVYGGVVFVAGGGGVTEFTELTDTPASYTGQASKVVAVKADESGLEFVAGGGTTPTLQEVTDIGAITTNGVSVQSLIIQGGDPPIDPVDAEMSIITYSDAIENVLAFLWADNMMVFIKDKAEVGGTYRMRGTGVDTEETIAFLSDISGGGAVDSVNGQTGVVVLDSDDISEGAANLYFTDARALGAIPDATPTVKGIAKLYTSLGSNTDGAVDQNTVNSALALKANAPLIDTVSSSALTGVTTEGILKSYLIPANTYTASEILNFANDLYKTGTAGTVTSRLYTNTTASLSGASLLATTISTAGNRKVPLRRQLVLKGGNIEVLVATQSLPDDNLNSSTVASLIAFNPAVDNYFITTAQNASAGDSTLQNNLKIHY